MCGSAHFALKQRTLALYPPTISGKRPVATHDTVAGNGKRNSVGGASPGHGTHCAGRADPLRQLGIAEGSAERNLCECLPDSLLKSGPTNIQRQRQPDTRRLDKAHHTGYPGVEILSSRTQPRVGETLLKLLQQLLRIAAQ